MVRAVRSARSRRYAILAVVLVAPAAALLPACSVLVSTDGLSGDADGGLSDDSDGPLGTQAAADAHLGLPSPGTDGSMPVDASAPGDAGSLTDAGSPADVESPADAGSKTDAGTGTDAGTDAADASVPPADAAPDAKKDANGPDADAKAPVACGGDLSNIGTGAFHVSLTVRTTQSGRAALLNQRAACTSGTYWDLRFSSGKLEIETDDHSSYTDLLSTGPDLNDGATHDVVVARVGGELTITIDGVASGSSGSAASFGALPALASGVDVCDGNDGTSAFEGTLSSVCVSAF
jgi:hypothetical protein